MEVLRAVDSIITCAFFSFFTSFSFALNLGSFSKKTISSLFLFLLFCLDLAVFFFVLDFEF